MCLFSHSLSVCLLSPRLTPTCLHVRMWLVFICTFVLVADVGCVLEYCSLHDGGGPVRRACY